MTDEPRASARELIPAPEPDYAVPPGESLRERLAELHMSQAEFARRTGLTTKHVNQVMQGVASLSAEVAQRLEYATGTPSWWWLRLEADYRDTLTRLSQREELAADVAWVDSMPVRELLRQGVLPDEPKDKVSRLQQLLAFFGVASVDAYEAVWGTPAAAFRQSAAYEVNPAAVAAWLRLGELASRRPRHCAVRRAQAPRTTARTPGSEPTASTRSPPGTDRTVRLGRRRHRFYPGSDRSTRIRRHPLAQRPTAGGTAQLARPHRPGTMGDRIP